jgi:hypothetical protein
MIIERFQWWRRFRRGQWARVTGFLWGKRWIRLPKGCLERAEEDWG